MKLLGLPGIRTVTGPWLQQLIASLEIGQGETINQIYQCWNNPGTSFNLETEATIAGSHQPEIIIAKSIGTRVALRAFKTSRLATRLFVFIGTPLQTFSQDEINAFSSLCNTVSVLLIQQTDDPVCSYAKLAAMVGKSTCCCTEVPGADHMYADIDQLAKIIDGWFKKIPA